MPIYHFHLCDGYKLFDPQGVDLPDPKAAARYGEQLAKGFVAAVRVWSDESHRSKWHVHVTDGYGATIGRFDVPEE
jgi:hypothetical protein